MEGNQDRHKERMDYRRIHRNPARDMKRFMKQEEEDEAEYKPMEAIFYPYRNEFKRYVRHRRAKNFTCGYFAAERPDIVKVQNYQLPVDVIVIGDQDELNELQSLQRRQLPEAIDIVWVNELRAWRRMMEDVRVSKEITLSVMWDKKTYSRLPSTIQLCMSDDKVYMIDAIKLWNLVMDVLRPLLMDETKILIIFNAPRILSLLKEEFGIFPHGAVDLQKAVKMFSWEHKNLSFEETMEHILGNSRFNPDYKTDFFYQNYDWTARPITQEAAIFAARNTWYLREAWVQLKQLYNRSIINGWIDLVKPELMKPRMIPDRPECSLEKQLKKSIFHFDNDMHRLRFCLMFEARTLIAVNEDIDPSLVMTVWECFDLAKLGASPESVVNEFFEDRSVQRKMHYSHKILLRNTRKLSELLTGTANTWMKMMTTLCFTCLRPGHIMANCTEKRDQSTKELYLSVFPDPYLKDIHEKQMEKYGRVFTLPEYYDNYEKCMDDSEDIWQEVKARLDRAKNGKQNRYCIKDQNGREFWLPTFMQVHNAGAAPIPVDRRKKKGKKGGQSRRSAARIRETNMLTSLGSIPETDLDSELL